MLDFVPFFGYSERFRNDFWIHAQHYLIFSIFGQQCPKMAIFAPKVAIFRPKVAILRALRELRKKCVQSFDFWPKMPENGHFCSKVAIFRPKVAILPKLAGKFDGGGDKNSAGDQNRRGAPKSAGEGTEISGGGGGANFELILPPSPVEGAPGNCPLPKKIPPAG